MGIGNEEDPLTPQESGRSCSCKIQGGGVSTSLPRLRRKNFSPWRPLSSLVALTQWEANVPGFARVSDQPGGPFSGTEDVLQLRLCAPGSLCLCAQNISYSLPSPLARVALRLDARGRQRLPFPRAHLCPPPNRPLVSTTIPALRYCFPRAKPLRTSPGAWEPCALVIWFYLPHFHAARGYPAASALQPVPRNQGVSANRSTIPAWDA